MGQALRQYVAHENENTAQQKWLVIKRYMIKHASPDTTPTHLKMTSPILQCRSIVHNRTDITIQSWGNEASIRESEGWSVSGLRTATPIFLGLVKEVEGGWGGGGGGAPASSVAQAGNEERGQNVNYCPPPSTPFTACAHLLYARTPAACSCCGCLF